MKLFIRLSTHEIHLSKDYSLPYSKTNLFPARFEFRENLSIFCKTEIVSWRKEDLVLSLRILEFDIGEIEEFKNQKHRSEINRLDFTELYWPAWSSYMTSYVKATFQHISLVDKMAQKDLLKTNFVQLNFKVPLKNVHFKSGYAVARKKFKWSHDIVDIKVPNENLIPEFEYIKPLFANYFGRKTIDVRAKIELIGDKVIRANGTSVQIGKIDKSVLDTLKFKSWQGYLKQPIIKPLDKSFFSTEELFEDVENLNKGNLTPDNFEELFRVLMANQNIRNATQLTFLAGKIHDPNQKVLITLHPNFGFIFYTSGDVFCHYIWELLNSHATYIWSFDKSISQKEQLEKLSYFLNLIHNRGRTAYKYSVRQAGDPHFNIVIHESANSNIKDHFPKWKIKVEQLLA